MRCHLDFHLQNVPNVPNSSPAYLVANSPVSRILPTIAGRSRRCGLVLNLLKDVFPARIHPLDPGSTCCLKSLVDIDDDTFYSGNQPSVAYICLICCSFCLHHLLLPLCHSFRSILMFNSFFILKTLFLLLLRSSQILVCCCPT